MNLPPRAPGAARLTQRAAFGEALRRADEALRNLTLFTGVMDDPIGRLYVELVDALTPYSPDAPSGEGVAPVRVVSASPSALYRRLFALLADAAPSTPGGEFGDAWQNHLVERTLADANPFSRAAEAGGWKAVALPVRDAAEADLDLLRRLYEFSGEPLREAVTRREPDVLPLPSLAKLAPAPTDTPDPDRALRHRFHEETDASDLAEPLANAVHRRGLGLFRDFRAFRWEARHGEGRLEGIAAPDPILLDDLLEYDRERRLLLENTDYFVAGLPANNALLYGDRGAGKSSTVKALLHRYGDRGLRMVEVRKEHLEDFTRIAQLLRGRRERFILFIDDLSFEEHETHYKELKALLEGGLEARPDNIVLYATSNRRHLVKERHSDRIHAVEDDEIHLNDTSEEKLSLSDRFGLTLTFLAPTQTKYLAIVGGMATRRGVTLEEEELTRRALAWATQRGGRSGRVARQFIDHLAAEQALLPGDSTDTLDAPEPA